MKQSLPDTFEEFGARAQDSALSVFEKTGFPDQFRKGQAELILKDISSKLIQFKKTRTKLLDIGCGLNPLTRLIVREAGRRRQELHVIDHAGVLGQVRLAAARKHPGSFPGAHVDFIRAHRAGFDGILIYSVAQYVHAAGALDLFFDSALALLAPDGRLLIGDLPNAAMRRRFMNSPGAPAYHHKIYGAGVPFPGATAPRAGELDDAVVLSLLERARVAGFHAYVLPQGPRLPFANRREDVLVERPR